MIRGLVISDSSGRYTGFPRWVPKSTVAVTGTNAPATASDIIVVGTTVQHYRIGERLGAGGMGEVYRGEDTRLGRPVALKFLPPSLKADPDSRARLLNEARAASMLRSPNIAVTYDIGEDGGTDFIVMEYVDGELLSSRVLKGPLPVREVVEIGLQVADALDEAHARGIVHRDIKSANLMRTERGLVKVLDFGLAKFLSVTPATDLTQAPMTMAGMVVGTVSYMAPEQALGKPIDHRADLFSLGVVLFELVTGRMPFEGTSPTEIIDHILHETPPPPSRYAAAVPPAFDAAVARALEKDPAVPVSIGESAVPGPARGGRDAGRGAALEQPGHGGGSGRRRGRPLRRRHDVCEHHPRGGRRLDRHRHRGDRQLRPQEHPRDHDHRPRAGLRRAEEPQHRRAPQRLAGDRHRPAARRDVDPGRRIPADRDLGAHHGQRGRGRDRRGQADGQGGRAHRRHLRAAGQDRLRAEPGAQRGAARDGDCRHRAARNAVGRRVRELRARGDEPAPGDARIDRPRDCGLRGRHPAGPGVCAGVGGPRRRLRPEGKFPQHPRDDAPGDGHGAARARASIRSCRTRARGSERRCWRSGAPTRRSWKSGKRCGSTPTAARRIRPSRGRIGSAKGISPRPFPSSSAPSR